MKVIKKFIKRLKDDKKTDGIYKRVFDEDSLITIVCEDSFSLWYQVQASDDFTLVAPLNNDARMARYRVIKGSAIELVTDGNFTVNVTSMPSAKEHPTGEKLIEIIENKPDNIKDIGKILSRAVKMVLMLMLFLLIHKAYQKLKAFWIIWVYPPFQV